MTALRRIKWDERSGAASNARRELPELASAYFARAREMLAKDPSPPKLHQLRLATKRLRYTLELFRPCYGPGLEARMAELRQVQQLLGEVNDCAAAARLLAKSMKPSAQRTRLEGFLDTRAAQKAQEFRKQWMEVFDAPGRESWWTGYLGREARTPSRTH